MSMSATVYEGTDETERDLLEVFPDFTVPLQKLIAVSVIRLSTICYLIIFFKTEGI